MTVSRPCYFGNLLLGVVGVDVNLAYILEDVTYYQDSLASYTFLIDNKGQSHRGRRGATNILIGLLTFTHAQMVITSELAGLIHRSAGHSAFSNLWSATWTVFAGVQPKKKKALNHDFYK